MNRTSKFFRETFLFLILLSKNYREKTGSDEAFRFAYNGYSSGPQKEWLSIFVQELTGKKATVSWYKPSLIFSSSFGSYWLLKIILFFSSAPCVFFSEENLATLKKYREYKTYLDGQPALAMGFDYSSAPNYRRFPLWLMYIFPPEFAVKATVDTIQQRLDEIEKRSFSPKTKFAAMIASHDGYASSKKTFGCLEDTTRSAITQQIKTIEFVHCPGKLLHNDDSLLDEYNDNKIVYLQQFLFNICAENAAVKGYVTEKIFEAIEGGTIPVYWGAQAPEPTILNQQRIIFWDHHRADEILDVLKTLYFDMAVRKKFLKQPIFTDRAALEIYHYFEKLRSDFEKIITLQS